MSRLRTRLDTRIRYALAGGALRRRALYLLGGLVLLGGVWIAVTGLLARQQDRDVQARLQQVRYLIASGQIDQARNAAREIPAMADRAQRLTTGPAWWLAAHVPYFGEPVEVARGTADAAQQVGSRAVPQLMQVARQIDPSRLRTKGNQLNLAPLIASAGQLDAAAHTLDSAVHLVDRLPSDTWLSPIDSARTEAQTQLRSIAGYVDAAARAAKIIPSMLGQDGPRRYFIGLQNEAELRGTGGLPGAFAIVVANHGKVTFTHFESDAVLLPAKTQQLIDTGLQFGPGYAAAYGPSQPTTSFVDSNVSPHFPYTAQIWAAMWQKISGEHVDGALAVDPTVLSYLLSVTGPATLPGGTAVSAANVVSLTQKDEYALFADNAARKAFLVSVLKASSHLLTSGRGSATQLARVMSAAAQQQRLLVWSSDAADERLLAETSYAGAIPQTKQPLVAPVLNNAAAGKLDYYLVRTLSYHRSGCGASRDVLVTLTLTNNAPPSGLSRYVTGRLDAHPPPDAKPGDNRTLLDYYATAGAQLLSATLDDKPTTVALQHDLGHPIFRMDLELPRGTTQTVTLHLSEPAGDGPPVIWRQPGVTPLAVTAYSQTCS